MRNARKRRGMALMLVVILTAMATVMGYALLATSSVQAQVSSSTVQAASADSLAESGVNLAMYYLQNPLSAPLTAGDSFWKGANNISFGSTVSGTADVTVTQLTTFTYQIVSTGRSSVTSDGQSISRTIKATVELKYEPSVDFAVGSNDGMTLSMTTTVKGNVKVKGLLRVLLGAVLDGNAVADTLSGLLSLFSPASTTMPDPVPAIPSYRTYNWYGTTYNATEITADLQSVTLGPTPGNPAGIYYATSAKKLKGNVTINGSLVIESGNLQITGANNQITPQLGFPGVVVATDIQVVGMAKGLTINGLVAVGTGVTRGGLLQTGSKLIINGSFLLFGASPAIDSLYTGTINITYDSSKVIVPGIGSASFTPSSLAVLSWD